MGKCLSKTEKRILPCITRNTLSIIDISQLEHDIELLILKLHSISLECKWVYQELLLSFSSEKAFSIKAKEILIQKELETLRGLLILTGNLAKTATSKGIEDVQAQKYICEAINCIDEDIVKNDIKEILENSKFDNEKLIESLLKIKVSKEDIQIQIEIDLKKMAENKNSLNLQRKSYRKRR